MHQIVRGGKLGIHADYNYHKHYGLDRRLNLLVYLNKDWREEYGGHLELWDRQMTSCKVRNGGKVSLVGLQCASGYRLG
jgi:Rps23 Pro-64 3,4-dihydroxylase Tpa1-like proline 4-hydroxylase